MNVLKFSISRSEETNDHETRIIVDGEDWLGDDFMGLDPPDFFAQNWTKTNDHIVAGRCGCGVIGCVDLILQIKVSKSTVSWTSLDNNDLTFDLHQYSSVIEHQMNDYSWEDLNRRTERLVNQVFAGCSLPDRKKFEWSSARIKSGKIHLSFNDDGSQELLDFNWDQRTSESAIVAAHQLKAELLGAR